MSTESAVGGIVLPKIVFVCDEKHDVFKKEDIY
jgi:hypothetical protein